MLLMAGYLRYQVYFGIEKKDKEYPCYENDLKDISGIFIHINI